VVRASLLALLLTASAWAQKYYVYVGNLGPDTVLLAWGTADGKNTIGRSSASRGEATVKIAGRSLVSRQNWIVVADLKPDTPYDYEISIGGRSIGKNGFRTWAQRSSKVAFFVIGDWGNASREQYAIAKAMLQEFEKRSGSDNPVRFVLTTGDNIYGDVNNFVFGVKNTGNEDSDWASKFFEPYQGLIAHVPFFPSLGNHDGNESESRRDLAVYLDNFFFPGDEAARYYRFNYGGLVDFFGLDSTTNTESGPPRPAYFEDGRQFAWMKAALAESKAAWKVPYYHHAVFNAGPRHAPSERELKHWVQLFSQTGVKVAFNGHEHNFQYSEVNQRSGGVRFVTSGAGGELRAGGIQNKMSGANMAGWAPENHFLLVEIEGDVMKITPIGAAPIKVLDASGQPVKMPLEVRATK